MKPFKISDESAQIVNAHPEAAAVQELIEAHKAGDVTSFIRLWLSEGIPSAFASCPMIYQRTREWLGSEMSVNPKQITIVGSARLGYSLRPKGKGFGRPFSSKSDLDFVVVSEDLFSTARDASLGFVRDFESKAIVAKSERQNEVWKSDVKSIRNNVDRGFIQAGKVPNLPQYAATKKLENLFWMVGEKLKVTSGCPPFTKASYRIYNDWVSFGQQLYINLNYAIRGKW